MKRGSGCCAVDIYCTATLTSFSDSISYITYLFLEWRLVLDILLRGKSLQFPFRSRSVQQYNLMKEAQKVPDGISPLLESDWFRHIFDFQYISHGSIGFKSFGKATFTASKMYITILKEMNF